MISRGLCSDEKVWVAAANAKQDTPPARSLARMRLLLAAGRWQLSAAVTCPVPATLFLCSRQPSKQVSLNCVAPCAVILLLVFRAALRGGI